jgi:hypothetical protein
MLNRHGLRCGVAIVERDAVIDDAEGDRLIALLQDKVFDHNSPVVLMAHDSRLGYIYYGRADLVRYLERLDATRCRWVEYTLDVARPTQVKARAARKIGVPRPAQSDAIPKSGIGAEARTT